MEQTERIQYYEEMLNEADTAIQEIERAIEKFGEISLVIRNDKLRFG